MGSTLTISLLGRFAVAIDDRELPAPALPHRPAAALVKLLALAPGHRLPSDVLIEHIWPEAPADRGRTNLRKAVHFARRALGAETSIETRADAVAHGARLLYGNIRAGALYSPTVLDRVDPEMALVKQETFGPVSPVTSFRTIDDAIRISNSTVYGLSSAVCTNRLDYITRFISELNVGSVNVREVPGYRLELTPFGGIKDSGLGYKEGVQEATRSFTNIKTYSLPWLA